MIVINEMWSYPNNGEVLAKNYEERVKTENPISLFACHMVDKCLNSYSYHFESDKVSSLSYVIDILKQDIDATIHMNFMNPVIKAFQSRLHINYYTFHNDNQLKRFINTIMILNKQSFM